MYICDNNTHRIPDNFTKSIMLVTVIGIIFSNMNDILIVFVNALNKLLQLVFL